MKHTTIEHPENITKIYGARIYIPDDINGEANFDYSPIEVKKYHPALSNSFELDAPYFQSANFSSSFLPIRMMNESHKISNNLTVFYSEDETVCLEWLNKEYEKILEYYKQGYERIKNTAVVIKDNPTKSYNMTI